MLLANMKANLIMQSIGAFYFVKINDINYGYLLLEWNSVNTIVDSHVQFGA